MKTFKVYPDTVTVYAKHLIYHERIENVKLY